jgi:hypothetical protein
VPVGGQKPKSTLGARKSTPSSDGLSAPAGPSARAQRAGSPGRARDGLALAHPVGDELLDEGNAPRRVNAAGVDALGIAISGRNPIAQARCGAELVPPPQQGVFEIERQPTVCHLPRLRDPHPRPRSRSGRDAVSPMTPIFGTGGSGSSSRSSFESASGSNRSGTHAGHPVPRAPLPGTTASGVRKTGSAPGPWCDQPVPGIPARSQRRQRARPRCPVGPAHCPRTPDDSPRRFAPTQMASHTHIATPHRTRSPETVIDSGVTSRRVLDEPI